MSKTKADRTFVAPERVFVRSRGCYSCKHFENQDLARLRWSECRKRDIAVIQGGVVGVPAAPTAIQKEKLATIEVMDGMVKKGMAGLCMKGPRPDDMGGPPGDFVHAKFLCDRWSGRTGHSVATSGRKVDKLNEELKEIAEDRAKSK